MLPTDIYGQIERYYSTFSASLSYLSDCLISSLDYLKMSGELNISYKIAFSRESEMPVRMHIIVIAE